MSHLDRGGSKGKAFLLWAGANYADQGQPNISGFCLNTFLEVAEPAHGRREG